jgi:hypothetical protein
MKVAKPLPIRMQRVLQEPEQEQEQEQELEIKRKQMQSTKRKFKKLIPNSSRMRNCTA